MAVKEVVKAVAKVAKVAKAVAETAEEARKALGYTAKELQNISAADFNKLTNVQLKGALRTMQKATSQRKRRLEKSGVFSDALQGFEERGGIKTNLNNRVAMQAELKRAIQFMNAKTSTIQGARASELQAREDIGLPADSEKEIVKESWRMFHKLQEEYPNFLAKEVMQHQRYSNVREAIGKASQKGATQEQISKMLHEMSAQAEKQNNREVQRLTKSLRDFNIHDYLLKFDPEQFAKDYPQEWEKIQEKQARKNKRSKASGYNEQWIYNRD